MVCVKSDYHMDPFYSKELTVYNGNKTFCNEVLNAII